MSDAQYAAFVRDFVVALLGASLPLRRSRAARQLVAELLQGTPAARLLVCTLLTEAAG